MPLKLLGMNRVKQNQKAKTTLNRVIFNAFGSKTNTVHCLTLFLFFSNKINSKVGSTEIHTVKKKVQDS